LTAANVGAETETNSHSDLPRIEESTAAAEREYGVVLTDALEIVCYATATKRAKSAAAGSPPAPAITNTAFIEIVEQAVRSSSVRFEDCADTSGLSLAAKCLHSAPITREPS
jgi:hypothetical protein